VLSCQQREGGGYVKSHVFKVVIEEDALEDGRRAFHASCPALKGCHTWGHTPEEALTNIDEAVALYVEDLRAAGEPIPVDPDLGAVEWPSPAVVVNV
jgi:predicted RNase H-like HicB family nuclease